MRGWWFWVYLGVGLGGLRDVLLAVGSLPHMPPRNTKHKTQNITTHRGFLTLIVQDGVQGLQFRRKGEGGEGDDEWVDVPAADVGADCVCIRVCMCACVYVYVRGGEGGRRGYINCCARRNHHQSMNRPPHHMYTHNTQHPPYIHIKTTQGCLVVNVGDFLALLSARLLEEQQQQQQRQREGEQEGGGRGGDGLAFEPFHSPVHRVTLSKQVIFF